MYVLQKVLDKYVYQWTSPEASFVGGWGLSYVLILGIAKLHELLVRIICVCVFMLTCMTDCLGDWHVSVYYKYRYRYGYG